MLPDIEDSSRDIYSFHLAGIVPVAGQKLDFQFPWHDCLMPIANNFLAVERAIEQCAHAGCETIWIVAHREMQPILRDRIGDWIYDYSSLRQAHFKKFSPDFVLRQIPIYYVPIHPKDRDKRDCLSWSVIYGSLRAFHISKMISSWVVPDKYFVSFPYGICNLQSIFESRSLISSPKNFYMTYNGKSVRDGEYLPFTFDKEDFKKFRHVLRSGTGVYTNAHFDQETRRMTQIERLPHDQQYSARGFTLDKVFGCATLEGNNVAEAAWYYNIDNWSRYLEFLCSPQAKKLKRPKYFKYHEWNPVGVDKEDLGD